MTKKSLIFVVILNQRIQLKAISTTYGSMK